MNSQTYLPADQYRALVDALLEAHADFDPRSAIAIALAEIGNIVPDYCREVEEPAPLAA